MVPAPKANISQDKWPRLRPRDVQGAEDRAFSIPVMATPGVTHGQSRSGLGRIQSCSLSLVESLTGPPKPGLTYVLQSDFKHFKEAIDRGTQQA